jgi:glycosyltransferase involved in cell wall biosynthesis
MTESKATQKRIAFYLPSLGGGGAERVTVTLANAIATEGFKVDIVLAEAVGAFISNVVPTIRIIDLKAGRVSRSVFGLARYLRQERPDAMISAMNHANVVAVMARLLSRNGVRLILVEHSTPTIEAANNRSLRSKIVYALMHWLYPQADAIVAVSNGVADSLATFARIDRKLITPIYNPFDIEAIRKRASEPIEHPWFAEGEPPVILGIGRLTAAKDFSTLIRAFALLRKSTAARLMILGEGQDRTKLESLIKELGLSKDEVSLPGFVGNPYTYIGHCGAFVLSSKWEGLPSALIEAIICGAPVVSTDCPSGPKEILASFDIPHLCDVGSNHQMAKMINNVINERCVCRSFVDMHEYDRDVIVKKYIEIIEGGSNGS